MFIHANSRARFSSDILKTFLMVIASVSLVSCKAADPDSVELMSVDKSTPTEDIEVVDWNADTSGTIPFDFGLIVGPSVRYKNLDIINYYSQDVKLYFSFNNTSFGISTVDCTDYLGFEETCSIDVNFYHTAPSTYTDTLNIYIKDRQNNLIKTVEIQFKAIRIMDGGTTVPSVVPRSLSALDINGG